MNIQKLQSRAYKDSQIVVKKFNDSFYRVYSFRSYPVNGLDMFDNFSGVLEVSADSSPEKLKNNLSRAKSRVFDLAICNDWDFFFTGTFNSNFICRDNIDVIRTKLTQFIRNYNRLHNCNIKYLFVPEKHKDNVNWHIHGFISGIPLTDLHKFQIGDKMGQYLVSKVNSGKSLYSWLSFSKKFGFSDLEPIVDRVKSASYITKYITKNTSVTSLGSHLFYASKGLKSSFNLCIVNGCFSTSDSDYFNDYVKVKTFYNTDDLNSFLLDNNIDFVL